MLTECWTCHSQSGAYYKLLSLHGSPVVATCSTCWTLTCWEHGQKSTLVGRTFCGLCRARETGRLDDPDRDDPDRDDPYGPPPGPDSSPSGSGGSGAAADGGRDLSDVPKFQALAQQGASTLEKMYKPQGGLFTFLRDAVPTSAYVRQLNALAQRATGAWVSEEETYADLSLGLALWAGGVPHDAVPVITAHAQDWLATNPLLAAYAAACGKVPEGAYADADSASKRELGAGA